MLALLESTCDLEEVDHDECGFETGPHVGRYVLEDRLGCGGMGTVFLAHDPQLDRKLAVKLLHAGSSKDRAQMRLRREAQAMARLSHPNVVTVYDVGHFGGELFVAMEYVEGCTLARWLERRRDWPDIIAMFIQAGRGLSAAHAAGLIHRDFKPANVLIDKQGRLRVTDFGLVRARDVSPGGGLPRNALEQPLTRTGSVVGTPAYMAPEQFVGDPADARSDQFSFCVALHEALWGVAPFAGRDRRERSENVIGNRRVERPKRRGIPTDLEAVIERGLSWAARDRWPSMDVLVAQLEEQISTHCRPREKLLRMVPMLGLALGLGLAFPKDTGPRVDACKNDLVEIATNEQTLEIEEGLSRLRTREEYAEVVAILDHHGAAWTAVSEQACEANEADRVVLHCLGEVQLERASLVGVLVSKAGTRADAKTILAVAEQLASPTECLDSTTLDEPPPLVEPELGSQVAALRSQLARAEALLSLGELERASIVVEDAALVAARVEHRPVLAEAQLVFAQLQQQAGAFSAAADTFMDAYLLAEACGHERVARRAALGRLVALHHSDASGDISEWRKIVEAKLERRAGEEDWEVFRQLKLESGEAPLPGTDSEVVTSKSPSTRRGPPSGATHPRPLRHHL